MPPLFAPNLSMLWPDQPFAERFGRAARAGLRAIELWWLEKYRRQPFAGRFGRAARAGLRAVQLWWREEYRRRTP